MMQRQRMPKAITLTALTALLAACGTRQPAASEPEPPPPEATARNTNMACT